MRRVTAHCSAAVVLTLSASLVACSRTDMSTGEDAGARADAGPRIDAGPDLDAPVICERQVTITFHPTKRLQVAIWAQREDPARFATIAVTAATGRYGIGNRPGALQMNSGFRWPIGRRENVLPGWAGSRLRSGAPAFPRVIYRRHVSEGNLSSAGSPADEYRDTYDEYACMSFDAEVMNRDGLDAVACASLWVGDKGRYLTDEDVAAGYAEPVQALDGSGGWRELGLTSGYPPRRDYPGTEEDHPDVARYAEDALAAMPELDAVTMATPADGGPASMTWRVPVRWGPGPVTISVEVNQEGDYDSRYGPERYPTPTEPEGAWDYWAIQYGYPYRGQPSVIFDVPIELPPRAARTASTTVSVDRPTRMGSLDHSLDVRPIDDTITDDPERAPGSGADRLYLRDGTRVRIDVEQVGCRRP